MVTIKYISAVSLTACQSFDGHYWQQNQTKNPLYFLNMVQRTTIGSTWLF